MLVGEGRLWRCSVVRCDRCGEEYNLGPGDGDNVSDSDLEELKRAGWSSSDEGDFCPDHEAGAEEGDTVDY